MALRGMPTVPTRPTAAPLQFQDDPVGSRIGKRRNQIDQPDAVARFPVVEGQMVCGLDNAGLELGLVRIPPRISAISPAILAERPLFIVAVMPDFPRSSPTSIKNQARDASRGKAATNFRTRFLKIRDTT
jgi:hypothetical protein